MYFSFRAFPVRTFFSVRSYWGSYIIEIILALIAEFVKEDVSYFLFNIQSIVSIRNQLGKQAMVIGYSPQSDVKTNHYKIFKKYLTFQIIAFIIFVYSILN